MTSPRADILGIGVVYKHLELGLLWGVRHCPWRGWDGPATCRTPLRSMSLGDSGAAPVQPQGSCVSSGPVLTAWGSGQRVQLPPGGGEVPPQVEEVPLSPLMDSDSLSRRK